MWACIVWGFLTFSTEFFEAKPFLPLYRNAYLNILCHASASTIFSTSQIASISHFTLNFRSVDFEAVACDKSKISEHHCQSLSSGLQRLNEIGVETSPSFWPLPSLKPWTDCLHFNVKILVLVRHTAPRTPFIMLCP